MFRYYSKPNNTQARVAVVGEHSEGVLKIAVARCSAKDHFIKKKGRAIAEGRLHKNKLYDEIRIENCGIKEFIKVAEDTIQKVQKNCTVYNTPPKEKISPEDALIIELDNDVKQAMINQKD